MKHILFLLLFLPAFAGAQKIETAVSGDKVALDVAGDYLVLRDTSLSGVITISLIPTTSFLEDAKSKLGSVESRIDQIAAQIQELQEERAVRKNEKNDLEKIINKIGGSIAPKSATPAAENKTFVDPEPAPAKPKKKRKQ